MINFRKYTEFFHSLHPLAFIFLILFSYATPQTPSAFAQDAQSVHQFVKSTTEPKAVEGEFLISFKSKENVLKLGTEENPQWLKELGKDVEINKSLADFSIAHIKSSNPAATGEWQNLANILSSDPNVDFVEPNYLYYSNARNTPNDPMIGKMWYLDKINAFESWPSRDQPENEIIVAVIDTGIHLLHEELRGKAWINKKEIVNNGIDDDGNGYVDDIFGWNFYEENNVPLAYLYPGCTEESSTPQYELHGTHVAATIAAANNNQLGGSGVAPNVKIMALKALGGPCGFGSALDVLQAVLYAYQNGAQIINMSLGSYGFNRVALTIYKLLIEQNVLVVAAAGNEGVDSDRYQHFPSGYELDGIISVGASNPADGKARFSNYGQKSVDIYAPGVQILNAIPGGQGDDPSNDYAPLQGTSMATPVVSGAAAVIWAQNQRLTNLEVKAKLLNGSEIFDHFKPYSVSGGRLDIYKALSASSKLNSGNNNSWDGGSSSDTGGIRIFNNRSR